MEDYIDQNFDFRFALGVLHNAPMIPVPSMASMPDSDRCKHVAIFGKTGSGKSTLLSTSSLKTSWRDENVVAISPEGDFFRKRVLTFIPNFLHVKCIYFAPADPNNTLTFNPLTLNEGDDPTRSADELFSILSRIFGKDDLGSRMKPILQNAITALVLREGSTLRDIKHFLVS